MAGRLTNRKKQAMETRARIQGTALDLFNRYGFENVSMEQIAQEAGCSAGNIYHYFKSKDELAIQITAAVDAAYLEIEAEYDGKSEISYREKLLDFVGRALKISSEEDVLYKSFIHGLRYPEQGVLKYKEDRVYFRLLTKLICGCQAEGSIEADYAADEIMHQFVTLHRGMLFQWRICEQDFDLVSAGKQMAENLLNGLRK